MSEPALTNDGWYSLHEFYSVDWVAWREASQDERDHALSELAALQAKWDQVEADGKGSYAFYSIVGQKADMVFFHLRETMDDLDELENEFNKTSLATYFLIPTYSYVSIVELSSYTAEPDMSPRTMARLHPVLPKWEHICFYPMNKKRDLSDNWYMLSMAERREMMKSHGMIGHRYAGLVKQIITGSVGFDAWEWGVTLFAHDSLQFKKLVYEMRFDEVSARFGEFGDFYVGNLMTADKLHKMMSI
jgi:chlorite dismutase